MFARLVSEVPPGLLAAKALLWAAMMWIRSQDQAKKQANGLGSLGDTIIADVITDGVLMGTRDCFRQYGRNRIRNCTCSGIDLSRPDPDVQAGWAALEHSAPNFRFGGNWFCHCCWGRAWRTCALWSGRTGDVH